MFAIGTNYFVPKWADRYCIGLPYPLFCPIVGDPLARYPTDRTIYKGMQSVAIVRDRSGHKKVKITLMVQPNIVSAYNDNAEPKIILILLRESDSRGYICDDANQHAMFRQIQTDCNNNIITAEECWALIRRMYEHARNGPTTSNRVSHLI